MGGSEFTSAPFSTQKYLMNEAKWAGKYVKGLGNGLGLAGLAFTGLDMYNNGFTSSNVMDGVMGGVSFIPGVGWVIGGVYFGVNTYLQQTTGRSFGEHFHEATTIQRKSFEKAAELYGPICFEKGTLVYTKYGMRAIESIQTGDSVYSYNLQKNEVELSIVENIFRRETEAIYALKFNDEVVHVTAEHPFYVTDKGWIKVKDLEIGDQLQLSSGKNKSVPVLYIKKQRKSVVVHNIEVSGNHNYFITNAKVLVHNKNIQKEDEGNNK